MIKYTEGLSKRVATLGRKEHNIFKKKFTKLFRFIQSNPNIKSFATEFAMDKVCFYISLIHILKGKEGTTYCALDEYKKNKKKW